MQQNETIKVILANVNMILDTNPSELRRERISKPFNGSCQEFGDKIIRNGKTEFAILVQKNTRDETIGRFIEIGGKHYACDFDVWVSINDKLHAIKESKIIERAGEMKR